MKGFASSLQLYGNPYTREYTDLDLLIRVENKEKIIPIMSEIGWELAESQKELLEKNLVASCLKNQPPENQSKLDIHHLVFSHADKPFRIEVHNYLYGHSYAHTLQVFERAETIDWEGLHYKTLSLSDHAVFIIEHGTRHQWAILHWLLDAVAIFSIQDEKLHRFIRDTMVKSGYHKHLRLTLQLSTTLFNLQISPVYTAFLHKKHLSASLLRGYCFAYIKSSTRMRKSLLYPLMEAYLFKAVLARTYREKLLILISPFKPSQKDIDNFPLPSCLMFIHVFLRPLFVLRRRILRNSNN